ncbi:MAG: DUF1343 domain-containing protein, partial [Acidobacteria bacterium]|nr:DUF1343 domain-containing protein [Acidobacteriota bacterium]
YPDHFRWRQPPYEYETEKLPMDILCGDDRTRLEIEHKVPPHRMEQGWLPELEQFKEKRKKYLLY